MARARKTEDPKDEVQEAAPSREASLVEVHEEVLGILDSFETACGKIGEERLHSSLRTILHSYRECRDDVQALVSRIKGRLGEAA